MMRSFLLIFILLQACAPDALLFLDKSAAQSAPAAPILPEVSDGDTEEQIRLQKALELMDMKILSRMFTDSLRAKIIEKSRVSETEVRDWYGEHRNDYLVEPFFQAHQMVVYVRGNPAFPEKGRSDAAARVRAAEALAKLRAGVSWETVVPQYSDEVSRNRLDGLIVDGRFGLFASEVENAVRTQPVGVPGPLIKSAFGYHIVQVVDRVTEKKPRPFGQMEAQLTQLLEAQRSQQVIESFLIPVRREMGLELADAAKDERSLLNGRSMADSEILATIAGTPILEADFRWFLKDAFIPEQRMNAFSLPGARQAWLKSYLDMRVLAAKARKEELDKSDDFVRERAEMTGQIQLEFQQAKSGTGPFCGTSP